MITLAFDIQSAYTELMSDKPKLAADINSWASSVPSSITYLFSTVDGKHIYVGECCERKNGKRDERLRAHIIDNGRRSNFRERYKVLFNKTHEETLEIIGNLHVRWYEGNHARRLRLEHLVIALDAPPCNDAGIYHQPEQKKKRG